MLGFFKGKIMCFLFFLSYTTMVHAVIFKIIRPVYVDVISVC